MSIDLSTEYLGLKLAHPLMVGASPIVDDMDLVRRAEDAGAAAFVMHSLFEEQINLEDDTFEALGAHGQSFAEAMTYQPRPRDFVRRGRGLADPHQPVAAAARTGTGDEMLRR